VDSITVQDSTVKFVVGMLQLSYEGKLSPDGNSITGTWTQGSPFPFNFQKATKATAWPLPTDASPTPCSSSPSSPASSSKSSTGAAPDALSSSSLALGDTAHASTTLRPNSSGKYHVYGITRRGFGESSYPTPNDHNYSSDRLGDDVLAVIDALKLQKPVLVGHSIAGEELSSIGSRHPEKVSGLIYLDAGYPYAFYDRAHGDTQLDMLDTRNRIEQLLPENGDPEGQKQAIEALLASLPQLGKGSPESVEDAASHRAAHNKFPQPPSPTTARKRLLRHLQRRTQIHRDQGPCLAIFAVPHDPNSGAILPRTAPTTPQR
jgi:pimeloyl-ACP methyl ester carboxylesterase